MNLVFKRTLSLLTVVALLACEHSDPSSSAAEENYSSVFVGQIVEITDGIDGSTVRLEQASTNEALDVVISIPNLGRDSDFDFESIRKGNVIKASGERFQLDGKSRMTARTALSYAPITISGKVATDAERAACTKAGGEIKKDGKAQFEHCLQPYADAGAQCTDGTQCLGDCLTDARTETTTRGDETTGYCANNNRVFGCRATVKDGRYEGTICVD